MRLLISALIIMIIRHIESPFIGWSLILIFLLFMEFLDVYRPSPRKK
jgi:hypothetical protein